MFKGFQEEGTSKRCSYLEVALEARGPFGDRLFMNNIKTVIASWISELEPCAQGNFSVQEPQCLLQPFVFALLVLQTVLFCSVVTRL
jgi:hypothetical protein